MGLVTSKAVVLLFAGYTLLSVAGLLLLRVNVGDAVSVVRGGEGGMQPVVLAAAGMIFYAVSFALWLAILTRVPLTRAYPTSVGLTLVFTTFGAWALLDEHVGARELAGAATVFLGVWLLTGH